MMIFPSYEEAQTYRSEYRSVPVCMEMLSDLFTPIEVLQKLKRVSRHCYLLESMENSENWGRYTFLGYDPKAEITCTNGVVTLKNEGGVSRSEKPPQQCIRRLLDEYKSPKLPQAPPFTGGLVGYFSYDYIKYSEPVLNLDAEDQEHFRDADLMLFDKVIAFDNFKQKLILIAHAKTDALETTYPAAVAELYKMAELLKTGEPEPIRPLKRTSEFKPLFEKEQFCSMVERAKRYIYEGDIFQVVLSNRLEAEVEGSLINAYRVLRTTNPSPYMFYFSSDDIEIAGASPETLVKLKDGKLSTFPLAGTRPRGKTPTEDQRLEAELLADEKERAEHNMLVDLGRNDIGKISEFGSVKVTKYMEIERYSHVMHIGSTVEGNLRADLSALDAVDAILPAGTLSGAPKIRACEIINELENNKRGIYGGAIGYLDFTGNLDTCIAIRIAFQKNGKVFVRSGAGIVADSVPETEFQECVNKAKAVIQAIKMAEEMTDDIVD